MGEARRKKIAGNTEPNPNYNKRSRIPNYEIERASQRLAAQVLGDLLGNYPRLGFAEGLRSTAIPSASGGRIAPSYPLRRINNE